MNRNSRLLFAPLASLIFAFGVAGLALMVPGYNQVRETVSEIGETGSPARIPFTILLCCVAACLLVFASGVRGLLLETAGGQWPAYLVACMGVSAAGVGIFAFPHPLHNVFGLSELIGYQAPLAFALRFRKDSKWRSLVTFSWILFVLVWCCLLLNMSSMDRHSSLWADLKPVYGLVQRSLFATWFGWCAVVGVRLWLRCEKNPVSR